MAKKNTKSQVLPVEKPACPPPENRNPAGPGLILIALVFVLGFRKLSDYDMWWHLKTGEYILNNLIIPKVDIFSYVIMGRQWITFEWLSQALFFGVFKFLGAGGLIFFKSAVIA